MNNSDVTAFAETNFRNQRRRFGIKRDDRRRHMYVVGKTGMGKSTLLENLIIHDIQAGNGVAVVDPHGDLAEKILDFIPNERINDVIYFNPADTKYPIAFNILESIGPDYKHLVAYGLVGVFKKIWADSWGPRMEYIMTNTILALLDYPGSTLLGVMRMLVDKAYRKKVVSRVADPVIKTFWADEFANYSEKFRTEAIAPIQNKIGQFLASAIIRNIVGQSKSTIEMRDIMDKQKILIMNLSKGRVGEENSALLGAMMITKIQIAAMSRVDLPEDERKDFYLYVDEFQNFATDSFAGILSEARKYRLCLIMAHQYFEQLGDVVKAAVFGNVGTMIVFRVGAADAAELELEFAPQFLPTDIVNLKKYTFCLRLMIDGVATEPFSAIGLAPATGSTTNHDKIIKVSRERYARPQELVEDRIIKWSGVEMNRPGATPAGGVAADEDLGDDTIDWPDPVVSSDEENMAPDPVSAQTAVKGGVQLEQASEPTSSKVDVSRLIPGEVPKPSAQVSMPTEIQMPSKSTVVVEAESPLTVTVEPATKGQLEESVLRNRPRISFINHVPAKQNVDEPQITKTQVAQSEPPVPTKQPVVQPTAQPITQPVAVPKPTPIVPVASVKPQPAVAKPIVNLEADLDEEYEDDNESDSDDSSDTTTLSLDALKSGSAPKVQFGPQSRQSSPGQPGPAAGEGQKRKRKRKRKRSGAGQSSTPGTQPQSGSAMFPSPVVTTAPAPQAAPTPQPNPQSQPRPQAPQSAPVQAPAPKPQPTTQPAPQPKPVAQPASPTQSKPPVSSNNSANKVQWGDLL